MCTSVYSSVPNDILALKLHMISPRGHKHLALDKENFVKFDFYGFTYVYWFMNSQSNL